MESAVLGLYPGLVLQILAFIMCELGPCNGYQRNTEVWEKGFDIEYSQLAIQPSLPHPQ